MKIKRHVLLITAFVFACIQVQGKIWLVGKNTPHPAIKPVIEMAAVGDTVVITAGLYKEGNIQVDKALTIHGMGNPVLDGEGKYEILTIEASGTIVQNITFRNTGYSSIKELAAIKVRNVTGVTLHNNTVINTHFAIYLEWVYNAVVSGNRLVSNKPNELLSGNGIHCWRGDNIQIFGNTIVGHRDGIYFEFVNNSMIRNNVSYLNFRYGLHFMFSNSNVYYRNRFTDNGAGVAVMYSKEVDMIENQFDENWGAASYGLLIKEISRSTISGNRFLNNTTGVYIDGSTGLNMERNLFRSNGWAMKIMANCMEVRVFESDFLANTFDVSTNGKVSLNRFERNYWDNYEGYDLDRNGVGDVPYRPVSLYSMIVERNPPAVMFMRSFMVNILDRVERIMPTLIPELLVDEKPHLKRNLND